MAVEEEKSCSDYVKQLLSSCELETYIQKFIDERVDDDVLKILDDESIRQLIPIIGHRLKFKEALNSWKLQNESDLGSVSLSNLDIYVPVENNEKPDTTPALSTVTFELAQVLTILESNSDGRAIIAEGERTGGLLKESDRRRLSQIIILHLLENNSARVITPCEFRKIATEIHHLFPKESPLVYYSSYESDIKGRKKNASGKLYESYISRRRKLRARGELPGTSRSSSSSSTATATTVTISTPSDSEFPDDEEFLEKLTWLKNSVEPWQMVEEYWMATNKIRLEPIKLGLEQSTIEEYFRTYPALQQPTGYTLLLQDFETLYGDKKDGLFSNIVLLREKILTLAREKLNRTRDKDIRKTITDYINLTNGSDPETLTNVALILLAYLTGGSQVLRRGKKIHWRPSRSEIRDGFITQAATEAEVTSIIQTRREKLQRLGRTLQPFIIFVGESVAQVKTAYVIVNNTCYNFVKLVTAVDAAFKIFQATGAQYSEESMDIWLVIQIGFYKIKTVFDQTSQSSTSLLNDLGLL